MQRDGNTYSGNLFDIDTDALHVKLADEAHPVGPAEPAQSYLNMEAILDIAERSGAKPFTPDMVF